MMALVLAGHLLNGPLPPPEPQGTDLLWSQALGFDSDGMPIIPLGIDHGKGAFEVILHRKAKVILGQTQSKVIHIPAGSKITFLRRSSRPAKVGYFVIAESHKAEQRATAQRRLKYWRALGFNDAQLLPLGVQLALSGTGFDNRGLAIAVRREQSLKEAEQQRHKLQRGYSVRSHIDARLLSLPSGQMELRWQKRLWSASERMALQFDDAKPGAQFTLLRAHGNEDRSYRGQLEVVFDADGHLAAVALVRAEELVAGTVPAESYASAPLEALKSQAIAARTELLSKIGRRHGNHPYLLCDDQDCQVYRGVDMRHPRTDNATEATRGELLFDTTSSTVNGHHPLAHAQYSAICGGHTEDNDAVWHQQPSPLLRGHADGRVPVPPRQDDEALRRWIDDKETAPWCRVSSLAKPSSFRWNRVISGPALKRVEQAVGLGRLKKLQVLSRGVSGRALSLKVSGENGDIVLEPELRIRKVLGHLPSSLFVLKQRTKNGVLVELRFAGRGWGHGVGMCQMGAIGMAEAGYHHAAILKHYYPGSMVKRVY
jgi:stage II sporulation protein D